MHGASVTLLLAISQHHLERLESDLLAVSDPRSARYGQFLSFDSVAARTRNAVGTARSQAWLRARCQKVETTLTGDYVYGASCARAGLPFTHVGREGTRERAMGAVVELPGDFPEELRGHVDYVRWWYDKAPSSSSSSTTSASRLRRPFVAYNADRNDGDDDKNAYPPPSPGELIGNTTWQLIDKVYNVSSNRVAAASRATQGLLAIGQAVDYPKDLNSFAADQRVPAPLSNISISGPARNFGYECQHSPNDCLELSLDTEIITAVAQGADTMVWMADPNTETWFADFMAKLVNDPQASLVHSMSYDITEATHSPAVMQRFNVDAMKLGVRGITILTASGDDGVAGYETRNAGKQACGLHPAWPATSPYVLTVGATNGPEAGQPERACTFANGGLISSGGGFSRFHARPKWQEASVSAYLERNASGTLPPASMFNRSGRAYPDVALLGHSYPTVDGGKFYPVSGTSASTPVMAALLTLVNDLRLEMGKSPVGMVAPALYALQGTGVFHDITEGRNNCCAAQTDPVCCPYGFTAGEGWDAVTGLGSVDHGRLAEALLALG